MKRHDTAPVQAHQAPFFIGIDVGKKTHYVYGVDAEGIAGLPKATAIANTCEGYARLQELIEEATAHSVPTTVTVGCEATGPYWPNLYEFLTAQGYPMVVRNPFSVKARRGTTLRGTKTDTVDARLIAEIIRRHQVPLSHIPDAAVQGLRELTRLRADLVEQTSDVKRRVITVLDRTFPEFGNCFRDVCG